MYTTSRKKRQIKQNVGDVEQAEEAVTITGGDTEKLLDFFRCTTPGESQSRTRSWSWSCKWSPCNWDLSNLLPPIDDKSSLGRVNSTRVERKQLERSEEFDHMGFPDLPFSRLFAENKEAFVRFLLSYTKAIARARNVPIQIRVVNSLSGETALRLVSITESRMDSRSNAVEQKTENSRSLLKVEEARGQLVVTGNFLFLDRSKYHGVEGRSEMYGFVGTGDAGLRMDEKMTVAVTGTALHTETSLAFRVSWGGQDWWLKVGPDVQRRAEALQTFGCGRDGFRRNGICFSELNSERQASDACQGLKDVGEWKDLLFCCLEILNENLLPWSKAAESGSEDEFSNSGKSTCLVAKSSGHLYEPLLAHLKRAGHPLITDNTLNLSLHTKVDNLQPLICRKYQIQRLFRFSLQDDSVVCKYQQ
ncbi:hypothetical protein SELMODRAFT_429817 [Selaginella moellendorffii]|uniref:Uncharacterized protein n=1 Tax=Selaginella moellendorffii TaxID=88036 RepID=D8T7E4_SELML|nr:hypothetical protein SELMODRAFT_429817 [Selaginella moellendorffii]